MARERQGRKFSSVRERSLDSSTNDDWETLFEPSVTDKGTYSVYLSALLPSRY